MGTRPVGPPPPPPLPPPPSPPPPPQDTMRTAISAIAILLTSSQIGFAIIFESSHPATGIGAALGLLGGAGVPLLLYEFHCEPEATCACEQSQRADEERCAARAGIGKSDGPESLVCALRGIH